MASLAARFVLSIPAFTLIAPVVLGAQTLTGIGERAQGMGGAFVAVADDASAVYWNPAGLAWPAGATFDAQLDLAGRSAAAGSGARSPVFLAAATPPLGIAYYRLTVADGGTPSLPTVSDSRGRQNEGSGEVRLRALTTGNFGVTVNQTIVNGLVIGSTFRLVRGAVEQGPTGTTFDLDVGALVTAGNVRVGVAARNLRQPEFPNDSAPLTLERQISVGVALAPRALSKGVHGPFFWRSMLTWPKPAVRLYLSERPRLAGSTGWAPEGPRVFGRGCAGALWKTRIPLFRAGSRSSFLIRSLRKVI